MDFVYICFLKYQELYVTSKCGLNGQHDKLPLASQTQMNEQMNRQKDITITKSPSLITDSGSFTEIRGPWRPSKRLAPETKLIDR